MADVGQVVDIVDTRQRALGKGGSLFLKAQGLLPHRFSNPGQSVPGLFPASRYSSIAAATASTSATAREESRSQGPRLQVDLDHDQGRDDRKDSQKQRRDTVRNSTLCIGCCAQVVLRLTQLVANRVLLVAKHQGAPECSGAATEASALGGSPPALRRSAAAGAIERVATGEVDAGTAVGTAGHLCLAGNPTRHTGRRQTEDQQAQRQHSDASRWCESAPPCLRDRCPFRLGLRKLKYLQLGAASQCHFRDSRKNAWQDRSRRAHHPEKSALAGFSRYLA